MFNPGFRSKLFIASISMVVITITCMAGVNFIQSRNEYLDNGISSLENVSGTLLETISMQDQLARKKILSDLNIFKSIMGISGLPMFEMLYDVDMTITNQATGNAIDVVIPAFKLGSKYLHETTTLVDSMAETTGVESSILQLNSERLIRISTTIVGKNKKPVQGVYLPTESAAYKAILAGQSYEEVVNICGNWFLASYAAIRDYDENVMGALEVVRPVISPELAALIGQVNVGGKGFSYVFRSDGTLAVAPANEDSAASVIARTMTDTELQSAPNTMETTTGSQTVQSRVAYFKPWDAYIATSIDTDDILGGVNERIIKSALISSVLPLALSILVIWIMTRQLLHPINRLAAIADNVCKGNFECSFNYTANDAIGKTMQAVQYMVSEMKNQLGFSKGVLDGVTIPCAVVDLDNRLTHINRAAVEILGKRKTPDKYLGLTLNEVVYHNEKRKTLTQIAMKKRQQMEWEIELTRDLDHSTVILRVVSTPIYDLDNALIGAITIWVDLTEERAQQKVVQAKNVLIEQAAMEANQIAENVSSAARGLSETISKANRGAL